MSNKVIVRPTEAETVWLMHQLAERGIVLDLAFGPSGAWLEEDPDDPSEACKLLMLKRGVPFENRDGAGI